MWKLETYSENGLFSEVGDILCPAVTFFMENYIRHKLLFKLVFCICHKTCLDRIFMNHALGTMNIHIRTNGSVAT